MHVIHFETIDSTNKYLKENFVNFENFTFVSTNFQTDGKGRVNRKWFSNKNENLLFSFLIKEKTLLNKFKAISIGTATLIARFLELKGLKNVSVKWPNDVYVNDKKICGILLEGDITKFLVVGVGLNVDQVKFNDEYGISPTSMKIELDKNIDLIELEVELFEFIYKHINQKLFLTNTYKFIQNHNYLFSTKIRINNIEGNVDGIDKDFNLIVDGKKIDTGEVQILK